MLYLVDIRNTYRHSAALALILIFSTGWSLKLFHGAFLHPVEHSREICSIYYDTYSGSQHIHDERYSRNDCTLCAFVLSTPELLPCPPAVAVHAGILRVIASIGYEEHFISQLQSVTQLRGPPRA